MTVFSHLFVYNHCTCSKGIEKSLDITLDLTLIYWICLHSSHPKGQLAGMAWEFLTSSVKPDEECPDMCLPNHQWLTLFIKQLLKPFHCLHSKREEIHCGMSLLSVFTALPSETATASMAQTSSWQMSSNSE